MSDRGLEDRFDPFAAFINTSLDMDGVDSLDPRTLALTARDVLKNLPLEANSDAWESHLNDVQLTLRSFLGLEVVGRMLVEAPSLTDIGIEEVDRMASVVITLAFAVYNAIIDQMDEVPDNADQVDPSRQLWLHLRSASGFVQQAANNGDPVARRLLEDINRALANHRPGDWTNNTRAV